MKRLPRGPSGVSLEVVASACAVGNRALLVLRKPLRQMLRMAPVATALATV